MAPIESIAVAESMAVKFELRGTLVKYIASSSKT